MKNAAENNSKQQARRLFLRNGIATLSTGIFLPSIARATAHHRKHEKKLVLRNLHTGERLQSVFWVEGKFIPESLREINYLLRDFRTDEVAEIDPKLLVLIHRLHHKVDATRSAQIISGYRSPKTNASLRQNSSKVAKKSYHMKGMAIDLRIGGIDLKTLQKAAKSLKGGGVGYYPKSQFLHLDTGPVRYWT
ncbi:DUF882 domain-containing protein [Sneathiella sp. CAU 1612]|jgi:uncharacterized protein YcbK (DUF882 family)|uniref:Murein endopeptidase K n=1 Tax=Sneathiella sedimenti TaxID=2816034 RepID=A0ABS3F641_9PROT|nr:YcbK family protein [Sneathiella sedimenti]MBO0333993.1 DUF882 domain-containing protein [Sneathiella sedimenti]